MNSTKHYAKRDPSAQGIHYINHVAAMTTEGLHAKSAIAAELAHRDIEIERLRTALAAPAQDDSLTAAYMAGAHDVEKAAAAELRSQHAEIETLRTGYDAARLEIESLQKAATDRHALQATGAHPAPCARYCEAQAFRITMRNLHAEIERLRTCNKDAQHEIANLQERMQLARDVNSRRVTELEAQLGRWGWVALSR